MNESSGTKLEPNIAGLLCYALGWITGLAFLLMEKKDSFVRFHAIQSIIVFGIWNVALILIDELIHNKVGSILSDFWWILVIILLVVLMVKAYQGERFKLPGVGQLAEKLSKSK